MHEDRVGDKWIFLLLRSAKSKRKKDRRKGKELLGWIRTQNVFCMTLDHFIVAPLLSHKCAVVKVLAYDFGHLALSAFPVIFIICKIIFKGCPMLVLQYVTEGSISRLSLLTY